MTKAVSELFATVGLVFKDEDLKNFKKSIKELGDTIKKALENAPLLQKVAQQVEKIRQVETQHNNNRLKDIERREQELRKTWEKFNKVQIKMYATEKKMKQKAVAEAIKEEEKFRKEKLREEAREEKQKEKEIQQTKKQAEKEEKIKQKTLLQEAKERAKQYKENFQKERNAIIANEKREIKSFTELEKMKTEGQQLLAQKEERQEEKKATKSLERIKRVVKYIELIGGGALVASLKQVSNSFYNIFQTFDTARTNLMSGRNINEAWYLLGLNPTKDPREVFDDILKKLKLIKNEGFRRTRAQELGFNPDFMEALLRTNANGGNVQNIVKAFREIKITIFEITTRVALALAPVMEVVRNTVHNMSVLFNDIGIQLLKIFGIYKSIQFLSKHWLVNLGLILEDLYIFAKGGDSAFGRLLVKLGMTRDAVERLRECVVGLKDAFLEVLKLPFYPFVKMYDTFKDFKKFQDTDQIKQLQYSLDTGLLLDLEKRSMRNATRGFHKADFTVNQTFNIDGAKDAGAVSNEIATKGAEQFKLNVFQNDLNITDWGFNG